VTTSVPAFARVAAFAQICGRHPYRPKGLFYSEVFLVLEAFRQARVTLAIESGVKFGLSTRLLSEAFDGPLVSIDQDPCETPAGVTFLRGDARVVLPELLERWPAERLGILIDGPKGAAALALKDACLRHPAVSVVAVHDVAPGGGETAHSQDQLFRVTAGQALDALIDHPYARKYPNGPGLGVWVNPRNEEPQA
jgi:hypothetical protein